MRPNATQRNHWAQVGIGACALLLPPLTLGAALYSMLATPDESTARSAVAASGAQAVRPESLRGTMQPSAAGSDPQPAAQATQPVAGKPAPHEGPGSVHATDTRHAVAAGSGENAAPVSDPVPVQLAAAPSARANPPPPANMDGASTGSLGAKPSPPASADVSTALLPRVLNPSSQAPPQMQPPRMPATQMPATQTPLAADLPAGPPTAGKPARPPNPANRSETRRNTQPQRQHAFSLKNWLQQLGILPRETRG
jgi:hypothetical protein